MLSDISVSIPESSAGICHTFQSHNGYAKEAKSKTFLRKLLWPISFLEIPILSGKVKECVSGNPTPVYSVFPVSGKKVGILWHVGSNVCKFNSFMIYPHRNISVWKNIIFLTILESIFVFIFNIPTIKLHLLVVYRQWKPQLAVFPTKRKPGIVSLFYLLLNEVTKNTNRGME